MCLPLSMISPIRAVVVNFPPSGLNGLWILMYCSPCKTLAKLISIPGVLPKPSALNAGTIANDGIVLNSIKFNQKFKNPYHEVFMIFVDIFELTRLLVGPSTDSKSIKNSVFVSVLKFAWLWSPFLCKGRVDSAFIKRLKWIVNSIRWCVPSWQAKLPVPHVLWHSFSNES